MLAWLKDHWAGILGWCIVAAGALWLWSRSKGTAPLSIEEAKALAQAKLDIKDLSVARGKLASSLGRLTPQVEELDDKIEARRERIREIMERPDLNAREIAERYADAGL